MLASVEPSTITDIFSITMLLLFVIAVFSKASNRFLEFLAYAPSLLTSLGILGTFTGIVIGLFDFNIEHIDSSIALLLDGLKTAFITSILGISLSLILKLFMQIYQPARYATADITMEDLHNAMHSQVMATESLASTMMDNQNEFLATQQQLTDVAREHQHAFVENQRQLAAENREIELKNQQDFLSNQEAYLEKLDSSVARFAQEGVRSLVSEMHAVVKDFNHHVQTEFGENFQQFGEHLDLFSNTITSLGNEFGEHEERMQYWTEHCDANVISLVRVRNELEDVGGLLSKVPEFVGSFGGVMEQSQQQLSTINELLHNYGNISQRINDILPDMGDKLTTFTQSTATLQQLMTEDIKQVVDAYRDTLVDAQANALAPITAWQEQLDSSQSKLHDSYQQSVASMTKQSQTLEQQIKLISNALETMSTLDSKLIDKIVEQSIAVHRSGMQELAVHQAKTHQEMSHSLTKLIQQNHSQNERTMERQIDNIENHMEREIEQVMRTMGEALGMISGQFTRDYQGLITQMQGLLTQPKALEA
jgi:hypothetical protein